MKPREPLRLIKFQAPPPKGGASKSFELEIALKQQPGKWALVAVDTYPAKAKPYRDDPEYEVRSVSKTGKNVCDIYIRWIGPKK